MKIFTKLALIALTLVSLCLLFRGWIYGHLVAYEPVGERTIYRANSPDLVKLIGLNTDPHQSDSKAIVKTCLSLTSKSLKFTHGKNDINPNQLIETKKTHCVGYAAFLATVCNQMFKMNNLSHQWVATQQIGQLYLMGRSIHPYFKSAFFKDHDFVIIRNLKTGEEFGVDPALHDYTGIEFITLKK